MTEQGNNLDELKLEIEKLQAENSALLKLASHDMRSPLNKIFALVNLLKMSDEPLSDEQNSYLLNIENVLSDGLHRMRNLMDLRAIEYDEIKVHLESIDLGRLLHKIVREHVPIAERKKIKLEVEADSISTITDKQLINRIIDQLLSNAIKFSPEGSQVKISMLGSSDEVQLVITDGGYGISEAEQTDLFKKFKVLSPIATGGESKTGLGLFIAQSNANKLGARIFYRKDEGSSFVLKIPVVRAA